MATASVKTAKGKGSSVVGPDDKTKKKEMEELESDLANQPYFHGILPLSTTDTVLTSDGEFLVRYIDRGETRGFVLSLRHGGRRINLKIMYDQSKGLFLLSKKHKVEKGKSIKALIEFHWKAGKERKPVTLGKESTFRLRHAVPRSRWELDATRVTLGNFIGKGHFGDVCKGSYAASAEKPRTPSPGPGPHTPSSTPPRDVAVKLCRQGGNITNYICFENEAHIQRGLVHDNIVETIGITTSGPTRMIVLEFMSKGSLEGHLKKHGATLDQRQLEGFCLDACKGMAYLESLGIIHRDIAARNCLVSSTNHVKISDFGLSKSMNVYVMVKGQIPIRWLAPEAILMGNFSGKSDVWAFGVFCWEVFSKGERPYPGKSNADVRKGVTREGLTPDVPPNVRSIFADAMRKCWIRIPSNRPSFADLLTLFGAGPPTSHPPPLPPSSNTL